MNLLGPKKKGNEESSKALDRSITKRYLFQGTNVVDDNRILRVLVVVIAIATVFNAYNNYQMSHKQRTVIMPPGVSTTDIWVSDNQASTQYLRVMTEFIARTWGDVNAANAGSQMSLLLGMVHPSVVRDRREEWLARAKKLARYKLVSFYIEIPQNQSMEILNNSSMTIEARRNKVVSRHIEDTVKVVYTIDYRIDNGQFWIIDIKERFDDA